MIRIRNVRRTSKQFPTNKVDFLKNNVDLRTKRTMTVFRNATYNVRTEGERLASGSRPYYAISRFRDGRGEEGPRARITRETLNPYISETAKESPVNFILKKDCNELENLIKVVSKLRGRITKLPFYGENG